MNRAEIIALLTELGRRLALRSISGEMYVVGGAAIALAFDERRSTRDIDAMFEPKAVVYEVARDMAEEMDLPSGWLNDAAKRFVGDLWRPPRCGREVLRRGSVRLDLTGRRAPVVGVQGVVRL